MKKSLVILSNNLGTNFSGGCLATCRIFEQFQDEFETVIAVCNKVGNHNFNRFDFMHYSNFTEAISILKKLKKRNDLIFYGDFYMAYYFNLLNIPFYFTYHDNWPEQKILGLKSLLQSYYYIPIYRWIFKKALAVIHVSQNKFDRFNGLNRNSFLVRNGINTSVVKTQCEDLKDKEKVTIAMIGNIDQRKFGLAVSLFELLAKSQHQSSLNIKLYGHPTDQPLTNRLNSFPFVSFEGFQNALDFRHIDLCISTSKIENLSIAVCESLVNFTPVIAFDVGGLSEVISNNVNGRLIPPFKINQFSEVLQEVVEGKVSFNFEKQNLKDFNWQKAGDCYRGILNL